MNTSSLAYHQGELQVALDAANPQRLVPEPGAARAILDIGCGAGQTMVALNATARSVGIDVDVEALRFGGSGARGARSKGAPALAGDLPFLDGAFDYVYSRVALPYMDVPRALSEMH